MKEDGEPISDAGVTTYRSGVGKLLYLVKLTRPDLASAICELSKFMSCPTSTHMHAMYCIIQYAVQTVDLQLHLTVDGSGDLIGYTDANWASDRDDRKSVGGFAIYYGGALVSWKSKAQQCTTLSSTESEYVALSSCINEMEYIYHILQSLEVDVKLPMRVYVDNTGAIDLGKNWSTGSRTKHIDLRHHYIREVVEQGLFKLCFVRSLENTADIFTKNLPQVLFEKHQKNLGVVRKGFMKDASKKEGVKRET